MRLGRGRAAGLARRQRLEAGAAQPRREQARLGRLAGPLPAFERDEAARRRARHHGSR